LEFEIVFVDIFWVDDAVCDDFIFVEFSLSNDLQNFALLDFWDVFEYRTVGVFISIFGAGMPKNQSIPILSWLGCGRIFYDSQPQFFIKFSVVDIVHAFILARDQRNIKILRWNDNSICRRNGIECEGIVF